MFAWTYESGWAFKGSMKVLCQTPKADASNLLLLFIY